ELRVHLVELPRAQHAAGHRLPAEEHVLGDGQLRHHRRFLRDRRDAVIKGLARRAETDVLAVEDDAAAIGHEHSGDDASERLPPCPVLADEGVDTRPRNGERDVVERLDAAEVLGDAQELEVGPCLFLAGGRRCYPGHSALNCDALSDVTTPPLGSPFSTSMPPQPLPVFTAWIAHCIASLPSVAGRWTTVPNQAPDATAWRPTAPPP